ncbi:glutaminase A [Myroides pelagicus]|uniref:Glutaminase n=1 Tax=Myroides pelagicus TaxID=270914 RepID=A0A7K1GLV8_9FLAO|nr:glutaminase A [Myroides pelagicus]MEC4114330.1 glutaminase A [Myroides pelagicus]MTH29857.1 glutaminase A [Myroides pelagicus]
MKRSKFSKLVFGILFACVLSIGGSASAKKIINNTDVTQTITTQMLSSILEDNREFYKQGVVADYIPELGKMDPKAIAFSVVKHNGEVINVGDVQKRFTIQSISKTVALMIAVQERGEKDVLDKMGYYGTNMPFNHFANLETTGKPLNPMMNAGAILTTGLIEGEGDKPLQKILDMIRYITKDNSIEYSEKVYLSEKETGHRNRGMFYLMKNNGLIEGTEDKLDNYFRQCSIEVTAEHLAKIGYFFANQCVRYDGDDRYKSSEMSKLIQSQMLIAGMYDGSGEYARNVGLPSKSGVGGGIMVSVPGRIGVGAFSASLDASGNSVAGYHMILDLVNKLDLNLFK